MPLDASMLADPEIEEIVISSLKEKRALAVKARQDAAAEVHRLDLKLAQLCGVEIAGAEVPTTSGRMRKGEPQRLITELLRNRNGSGAAFDVIIKETKVSSTTAWRVLDKLVEFQLIEKLSDRTFRWRHILSAVVEKEKEREVILGHNVAPSAGNGIGSAEPLATGD